MVESPDGVRPRYAIGSAGVGFISGGAADSVARDQLDRTRLLEAGDKAPAKTLAKRLGLRVEPM